MDPRPPRTPGVYTPSELNREVKLHIEAGFGTVAVEGELSNLSRPASGHLYFSLKDDRAQLRCALFRSAAMRLRFKPENGQQVVARGRLSLYEARGEYQMIVEALEASGEGRLRARFEALKRKLDAEGLFAAERKRPLPAYPSRIAVVTSATGAVLRDIVHVLEGRWPLARVRVYPTPVQGAEAPAGIVRALAAAGRHGWAEVVICGRGGGSLEDLWAFNEEAVARAIAACPVPVISAVGHETDVSIADFVADARAPTPSAAAAMATPDRAAVREAFSRQATWLRRRMEDRLQRHAQALDHAAHRLRQQHPGERIRRRAERLAALDARLRAAARLRVERLRGRLDAARTRLEAHHPGERLARDRRWLADRARRLEALARRAVAERARHLAELARTLDAVSPLPTLARGYAVLTNATDGAVISGVSDARAGMAVDAQLRDGRLRCTVDAVDDRRLEWPAGRAPRDQG